MIMAKYHEPSIGKISNWYTPPPVFARLGLTFDLDPAHPGLGTPYCVVPARRVYTEADDGLRQPWHGLVFMNPPFGARYEHVPWLCKFLDHGNGVAIVRAYTSSNWFHEHVVPRAETLCFPRGKTKFVRPDGSIGKEPGHGVVLIGMGEVANVALERSELGFFVRIRGVSQAPYDGIDDFAKSLDDGYRAIRARVAAGGKGWMPK
jgi:DNA N-6-adenine-methyltransferase (Dam)